MKLHLYPQIHQSLLSLLLIIFILIILFGREKNSLSFGLEPFSLSLDKDFAFIPLFFFLYIFKVSIIILLRGVLLL